MRFVAWSGYKRFWIYALGLMSGYSLEPLSLWWVIPCNPLWGESVPLVGISVYMMKLLLSWNITLPLFWKRRVRSYIMSMRTKPLSKGTWVATLCQDELHGVRSDIPRPLSLKVACSKKVEESHIFTILGQSPFVDICSATLDGPPTLLQLPSLTSLKQKFVNRQDLIDLT